MEVILLDKVRNLGNLGDRVKVRSGYGRNYLIPTGLAVMATESNVAKFEAKRAELESRVAAALAEANERAAKLAELGAVTITARTGDEGKLFGSVSPADIADAVTAAGVPVAKREVRMPEGTIRHTGEYAVDVQLHNDVVQSITVTIVAE